MLFDTSVSAFRLSLGLVIPATVISAFFFVYVFGAGCSPGAARPGRSGTLVGKTARTITPVTLLSGKIFSRRRLLERGQRLTDRGE